MKWQSKLMIILAILNLCTIGFMINSQVTAQSLGVVIPILSKDSYYIVTVNSGQPTCIDVENRLGLPRGAITQIEYYPSGKTKVYFSRNIMLSSLQIGTLDEILNKYTDNIEVMK